MGWESKSHPGYFENQIRGSEVFIKMLRIILASIDIVGIHLVDRTRCEAQNHWSHDFNVWIF